MWGCPGLALRGSLPSDPSGCPHLDHGPESRLMRSRGVPGVVPSVRALPLTWPVGPAQGRRHRRVPTTSQPIPAPGAATAGLPRDSRECSPSGNAILGIVTHCKVTESPIPLEFPRRRLMVFGDLTFLTLMFLWISPSSPRWKKAGKAWGKAGQKAGKA